MKRELPDEVVGPCVTAAIFGAAVVVSAPFHDLSVRWFGGGAIQGPPRDQAEEA